MVDRFLELFRRRRRERELHEEIRAHIEMAVADRVARGESREEAERAAWREFGNEARVREVTRTMWGHVWLDRLAQDVRFGARSLRRDWGFTVVTVLTLGLGIGASAAIVRAAGPVLLAPLDAPQPDRLFYVHDVSSDGEPLAATFGTFREVQARSRSFEGLAVARTWQPSLSGLAQPERLEGRAISADYLRTLGEPPALGRDFQPSDDLPGAERVAILSDELWRTRLGGDSAVVGSEIRLDDLPYTVIGVMPAGFRDALDRTARIWTPLRYDPALPTDGREWGHHLDMVGRLAPGVDAAAADRELDAIAAEPVSEIARPTYAALDFGLDLDPLGAHVTRTARPVVLAVVGAVLLLLVIVLTNAVNLLLARAARRTREFELRTALGAGWARLSAQLITETTLVMAGGAVLGLLVGALTIDALASWSPVSVLGVATTQADGVLLGVVAALTLALGAGIAVVPMLESRRSAASVRILTGTGRATRGNKRMRTALAVSGVAVTVVLLVGSGLLLRSAEALVSVDPGFETTSTLGLQVQTSGPRFSRAEPIERFFTDALESVRALPQVTGVALTSQLPLSGEADRYGIQTEAQAAAAASAPATTDTDMGVFRYAVSPGYFDVMGIPLRRGRLIDDTDRADAPGVVLVSESLARRRFPGEDPIGQRVHVGRTDLPWYTIVGVVGDVKQTSMASASEEAVYVPHAQWYFADPARWLVLRAAGDPGALTPSVREAVWSVDPDRPIVRVHELTDAVAGAAGEQRFAWVLFSVFGLAALGLASVGLYGILSESVTERVPELGVRAALGAPTSRLVADVARQSLAILVAGLVIGWLGAASVGGALSRLLFDVSSVDLLTYAAASVLVAVVAVVACAGPTVRATRVSPLVALRER